MGNLIKNEFTKVFKKKTLLVLLIITIAYSILNNCIYKFAYSNLMSGIMDDTKYLKESYESELKTLDPKNAADNEKYIETKSQLELLDLKSKYERNSWQDYIASTKVIEKITEKNKLIYSLEKTDETNSKIAKVEKEYSDLVKKINESSKEDGWKYFVSQEIESVKAQIQAKKELREISLEKQPIDEQISSLETTLKVLEMRIEKNIGYGSDFLSQELEFYNMNKASLGSLDLNKSMSFADKKEKRNFKENYEISKYVVETGNDVKKIDDLRGSIKNIFADYSLFIMLTIIIVAGTIVSSEFEKGTIKLLLTKPYSRTKILLSKYVVVLSTILLSFVAVTIIQFVVGGIFFGFDSLSVPIVAYDFNLEKLIEINNFKFLLMQSIAILPMFILIATFAFALGAIASNSALSITISLLLYMVGSILNAIAYSFNVKIMKFLFSVNWDFNQYLLGRISELEHINLMFSTLICIAYFLLFMIPAFIVFKKKNIKNI